jgi:hypothetical protein
MLFLLLSSPLWGKSPELVLDDFESEQPWEIKEWGDWATLSLDAQHASHGKKALRIRFDKAAGPPHPKGIVIRRSLLGRAIDYRDFTFDIYVDAGSPLNLGIGIDADRTYERPAIALQPGWNRDIQLKILDGFFHAWDQTQGKVPLKPELAIGSLILSFQRQANEAGSVYLDHIRSDHRPEWNLKRPEANKPNSHAIRMRSVSKAESRIPVYQRLELTVDLDAQYLDPYDPDEIELKGLFTAPNGKVLEVPGYFHSGVVDGVDPVRQAVWKLRFTPNQAGEWTYVLTAKNRWNRVQSETFTLQAEAGTGDGFVRIDPKHPQYFTLDSGRFYYPIGQNVAWLPFEDYERYFTKMSQHGENWARIWMTSWSYGIEWKPMGQYQGLGTYNLDRAQKLDDLLRLAETHGIYLQLVFDFHGAFSSRVNPEWSNNPYNVINGGFLTSPEQFFTHPQAKALYKKRLRYIIARWGYSPHVMAWEFFNEVSFIDNFNERTIQAWHQEMASYVKQLDPYQHLTTTSFGGDAGGETYRLPSIDFSQYHVYAQNLFKQIQRINAKLSQYNKPHFIGEFGSDAANGRDDQDRRGVFLHAGLWSQFMHLSAGNAMPWWWDTHIEANHLYYHFAALAHFAKDIDRRLYPFTPVYQKLRMQVEGQAYDFDLIGLQSPELTMFWLCDSLGMTDKGRPQHFAYEGIKVALPGFQDQTYDVEYWDTYKGRALAQSKSNVESGSLVLELPRFTNDVAFKIRPRRKIAGHAPSDKN